jgi:diaminohydroxyphosphoribosylaminopyrimidine deaminase/5-amino-6-(5-phosphoribosylamino)uracil reductase
MRVIMAFYGGAAEGGGGGGGGGGGPEPPLPPPPLPPPLRTAGIARVIYGEKDLNAQAAGGEAWLRGADIACEQLSLPETRDLNAPFVKRVTTALPWVIAKWAQTVDGRIATRAHDSKWISGDRSRAMVHRERGRVDAILTGIGTVMRDDPLLTCRVGTPRRNAVRVVVDPELTLPLDRQVVRTAREHRTVVTTLPKAFGEKSEHRRALGDLGVGCMKQHSDFHGLLEALRREFDVSNVLIEAGGGLTGALLREGLIDEAWVFVGPRLLADEEAFGPVRGFTTMRIEDGVPMRLLSVHRRGPDALLHYRFGG